MAIGRVPLVALLFARLIGGNNRVPDLIAFQNAPPNLYPEGFVHDKENDRLLVSSLGYGTISTVSYNGDVVQVAAPFDPALGLSGLGLELDYERNRVVFAASNLGTGASGIAALDLTTWQPLFVSYPPGNPAFDDIAIDEDGNAYVTGLFDAQIFKVTPAGVISLFTTIPPSYPGVDFSLNGIVSVTNGRHPYLVVGSLNTHRASPFPFNNPSSFYKVPLQDGSYSEIPVSGGEIFGADGMQISKNRKDIMVVVTDRLYKLTSHNNWESARVTGEAEITSPEHNNPGSTAGDFVKDDFYVLEGYLKELILQGPQGRTAYWAKKVTPRRAGRHGDDDD